jgi:hypothetical protein
MKSIFFLLVLLQMSVLNVKAFTIYDYNADAFVLLEEYLPISDSYKPIGTGLLVAETDCYNDEIRLVTKPEFLKGHDSVFVNLAGIELYSFRGLYPVHLTREDKILWVTYRKNEINIAAVPIPLIDGMYYAIDTAYSKPISKVHQGDDAVFFEFITSGDKTPDEGDYPFARKAIVSSVPFRNTFYTKEKWELFDSTFIIDAKVNSGSICSPVYSITNDSLKTITCIGMIQGPYKGPNGDQNLGVVVPVDAIIKILDSFRRCR